MLSCLLMICALGCPSINDRAPGLTADAADIPSADDEGLGCTQPVADQAAIIRKAEANDYTIRRLEFVGNESIRDGVLRKRMRFIQEGEKFRRSNLVRSLANVSRLKTIHPVRFSDVVLRPEESDQLVDVLVCFREKKH